MPFSAVLMTFSKSYASTIQWIRKTKVETEAVTTSLTSGQTFNTRSVLSKCVVRDFLYSVFYAHQYFCVEQSGRDKRFISRKIHARNIFEADFYLQNLFAKCSFDNISFREPKIDDFSYSAP